MFTLIPFHRALCALIEKSCFLAFCPQANVVLYHWKLTFWKNFFFFFLLYSES